MNLNKVSRNTTKRAKNESMYLLEKYLCVLGVLCVRQNKMKMSAKKISILLEVTF